MTIFYKRRVFRPNVPRRAGGRMPCIGYMRYKDNIWYIYADNTLKVCSILHSYRKTFGVAASAMHQFHNVEEWVALYKPKITLSLSPLC